MRRRPVIVVGAGIGGMTAAITAAEAGLDVTLVEKGETVGGAAAYSGGQVWTPANHVAACEGIDDSIAEAMAYVNAAAHRDVASVDERMCETWLRAAADAARELEELGVITWEVIPDYPDYYFPDLPGSKPTGRYLTGAAFAGARLGTARAHLHVSPHFPVGITYGEMFGWGGLSSKTEWDWELVESRRADDVLTFGSGIAAALYLGVIERGVSVRRSHPVVALLADEAGGVIGVRCAGPDGDVELDGVVIIATGSHDWSAEHSHRFTGIPDADGGSVAPATLTGDAMDLVAPLGGDAASLPAWAAPVLPGYRLDVPAFPGDTGFRACYEHCLPHTFLVNGAGERFADDSFHSSIVAAALTDDGNGNPANLPIYMIWDSQHHRKYGLGATPPGGAYPPGLVTRAATVAELCSAIGIDGAALAATAQRFNDAARAGRDADFGRGSNLSVRRFRGDGNHRPNPNLGTVEEAPFFGMRMRLLNTGIAAGGVRTDATGRPLRTDGSVIPGVHVVGEASARSAAGVGYNSGYSLSRAMAFGWLAARHIAGVHASGAHDR